MFNNLEFFSILGVIYFSISTIISYKIKLNEDVRKSFYWEFVFVNGIQFLSGLFWMYLLNIQSLNIIIKAIILNLIISYIITIEIPVYDLLYKYDNQLINVLSTIRSDLISLHYDYSKLEKIRTILNENIFILQNITIYTLLQNFIELCDRIHNYDKNMLHIIIEEINEHINIVKSREKNPFPELIKIISLTGMSFILAEVYSIIFSTLK